MKDKQFKKVYKISMRKHQGGVSDKDMPAYIRTGSPALRSSLRAINRNRKKFNQMNGPQKAESRNRGYEFLQSFFARCQ